MKNFLTLALLAAAFTSQATVRAVDLSGKWSSEFDTPVGHVKYIYEFKTNAEKLTGVAHRETPDVKTDAELKDLKLEGDHLSFSETLHFGDNEILVEYKGTVAGDELKLNRKVGEYGAKDIVAKREKAAAEAAAPSATGKWRAEFDTQIGKQKYLFTLKAEGNVVTGKANAEIGDQKMETALAEGKINGAEISFVENMDFGGNPVHIDYKGTINGDQMKLTRHVGDIATEELTATREK